MAEDTLRMSTPVPTSDLHWWQRQNTRSMIGRTTVFVIAAVGAIAFLAPFVWAISTSLKPASQIFEVPPRWMPEPVLWGNFVKAMNVLPFPRYYMNTSVITFSAMAGDVFVSTMVAYGFARMKFPGRDILFLILLATMMLPMQVTMIPLFMFFRKLGWVDTFWPLIIPAFAGFPFYIFLLRQFFLTIPVDLEDAALIDGASAFQTLWRIFVPLSGPAMATIAVFSFMRHWQDFFMPLIYLNSANNKTVALALQMFHQEDGLTQWNLLMAAAVTASIPCILLFFMAQRYFIKGIVMTGMK